MLSSTRHTGRWKQPLPPNTRKSGDPHGVTRAFSSSPATGREISAHRRPSTNPPTGTNHLGDARDALELAAPRTMEAIPSPKFRVTETPSNMSHQHASPRRSSRSSSGTPHHTYGAAEHLSMICIWPQQHITALAPICSNSSKTKNRPHPAHVSSVTIDATAPARTGARAQPCRR